MSDLKDWVAVVGGLVGLASMIVSWLTARSRANTGDIATLRADFDALRGRVSHVETEIRHIPTKDTVHALELSIAEIKGDIHAMAETFAAVQRTAQRIETYLLEVRK